MQKNALKLYWSRSKPNFGDWLSPVVCEMLAGRPVVYAGKKKCDLVAIGSLLDRFHENLFHPKIHVWGTGFIEQRTPRRVRFHYHALRGRLSRSLLQGCATESYGDPGLLADRIWPELKMVEKKYHVGFIPHYEDRSSPVLKSIAAAMPHSRMIDVFDEVRCVLKMIAECEFIFSSSLHGLIVSDAFGIPNAWIKLSDLVRGNDFKFLDYYSIYGMRPGQVFPKSPLDGLSELDVRQFIETYQRPGIDSIKDRLVQSFPFRAEGF